MVKLIRANTASLNRVTNFLANNKQIKQQSLLSSGYVVEINDRITGCFNLEPVNNEQFWLRQLYITQTEAIRLPVLVESILALASAQEAEQVFVKSHKLMLDLILESLLFKVQEDGPFEQSTEGDWGKWWVYELSK